MVPQCLVDLSHDVIGESTFVSKQAVLGESHHLSAEDGAPMFIQNPGRNLNIVRETIPALCVSERCNRHNW
ncbi:MAG: hypothetical protein RL218_893 [Actinomycetota bacterium]